MQNTLVTSVTDFDSFFDAEETLSESIKKVSYREHEFSVDPLAVVVDYHNAGRPGHEIYDNLVNYRELSSPSADSLVQADNIRRFFKNKIFLRRLKNYHISDYMKEMELVLESGQSVRSDRLPILVKLPAFYSESVETEALFKEYESLTSDRGLYESNDVWTFVKEISKYNRHDKSANYYFTNHYKQLLKVSVPFKEMGRSAWNYISSKEKIGIKGTLNKLRVRGYDFCLYQLTNSYELFDPR
jgi:hypothetical protein